MVTKDEVIEALKNVNDPEAHVDIWNLGLVYEITVIKGMVQIIMTFTSRAKSWINTRP